MAIWYPFSKADLLGNVNYQSTEELYFDEYWYENEYIKEGQEIFFNINSYPSPVSFAIWDHPFTSLPLKTKIGTYSEENIQINTGDYEYYQIYLKPGSSVKYNFTSTSGGIDFYIFDCIDAFKWDQGESFSYYIFDDDTIGESWGMPIIIESYYCLVWYNDGSPNSPQTVNISIEITATEVYDLSTITNCEVAKRDISGSYTVPHEGNWYFFIYFDPLYSPDVSTIITFDVTYKTGITSNERWISIRPLLITDIVIIIILIIAAFLARVSQKNAKKTRKTQQPREYRIKTQKTKRQKCLRCKSDNNINARYCVECGGKLTGRNIKTTKVTTTANSKKCSYCKSKLYKNDKFCKFCGTPIKL